MFDLDNRTVVVTGASQGIGAATARRFAEAGANVVGVARNADTLAETIEDVEAAGASGRAVVADVTDEDDRLRLFEEAIDAFGTPHVLVNNAGVFLSDPPLEQSLEDVDAMLDVNLRSVFRLSQLFGRAFRDSEHTTGGRIINISSNVQHVAVPLWAVYSATKAGVDALTRTFAMELVREGVTVNTVAPGTTRTPAVERDIEEKGDQLYNWDGMPMGDIADPEDIANACLFFASDLAEYVTAQHLVVDGGVSVTSSWYRGSPWMPGRE